MKILLCGSRGWWKKDRIAMRLMKIVWELPANEPIEILTGDAAGADQYAAQIALEMGWKLRVFVPEWKKQGRTAGLLRNIKMLEEKPDLVLAFWDGKSKGTLYTYVKAKEYGIPRDIVQDSEPKPEQQQPYQTTLL